MGVPSFFWYIRSRYPTVIERVTTTSMLSQCDNLFIDVNAIIHDITHNDTTVAVNMPYEILASRLMKEMDRIIMLLNPQKLIYIAVDGPVPRSKMNQQRERRFMAAQELIQQSCTFNSERIFDSNAISPGTPLMEKMNQILQYYISLRLSSDPVWKKLTVIYSSHRHPGEGEHKIMNYLRQSIQSGQFNENDRSIVFGSDADLILLMLTLHKRNVNVMRKAGISGSGNGIRSSNPDVGLLILPHLVGLFYHQYWNPFRVSHS